MTSFQHFYSPALSHHEKENHHQKDSEVFHQHCLPNEQLYFVHASHPHSLYFYIAVRLFLFLHQLFFRTSEQQYHTLVQNYEGTNPSPHSAQHVRKEYDLLEHYQNEKYPSSHPNDRSSRKYSPQHLHRKDLPM